MKHYIDAKPGSEEFRNQFRIIRDSFLSKLETLATMHKITIFRACNIEGVPIDWVWDEQQFNNAHAVGTLKDAKSFAAHMIDQGMHFAIMGADSNDLSTMWLTTWEEPDVGPNWPQQANAFFIEIHEGVLIGKPPAP